MLFGILLLHPSRDFGEQIRGIEVYRKKRLLLESFFYEYMESFLLIFLNRYSEMYFGINMRLKSLQRDSNGRKILYRPHHQGFKIISIFFLIIVATGRVR